MKWLLYIPLGILAAVVLSIATSTMWGWFVVPALGVPAINAVEAYGLILVIALFMSPITTSLSLKMNDKFKNDDYAQGMVRSLAILIMSGMALLVGYAVSSWWM